MERRRWRWRWRRGGGGEEVVERRWRCRGGGGGVEVVERSRWRRCSSVEAPLSGSLLLVLLYVLGGDQTHC